MNPLKVCIVGLKCFDHIAGCRVPRYLGGIETQLVLLAKGLVQEGCQVSLITFDHGQRDQEQFDGVNVLRSHPPTGGVPLLRWFHPRSTRLWKAMRQANADIYLQMGAGTETGQVAFGCRTAGHRKFVFCMASDANYKYHLWAGKMSWEGRVYQYGLRNAALIVAQTIRQQEGLRHAVGLRSQVIQMAAVPPSTQSIPKGTADLTPRVLWLGRITPEKRLEWLLETARLCPDITFDIVGAPNKNSAYATGLMGAAATLPNVKVHGSLFGKDLGRLFQSARVLYCTSKIEGFPTTFLEAWSCGIPVVTTFDPDDVVARQGLGRVAASVPELIGHLRELLANDESHSRLSVAAKAYYSDHHTVQAVARKFRLAFDQLLSSCSPAM